MTFSALLAFVGAALCGGLAAFIFWGDPRSFVHRTCTAGMSALTLMQVCVGMAAQTGLPADILWWERLGLAATAFVPGSWLLFSLSFARSNFAGLLTEWRWFILASFILPLIMVSVFQYALFTDTLLIAAPALWSISLGWSGYCLHLLFLLGAVVILMNLERTLRGFAGNTRWQIKFMILGLGSLFAVQIYTSSQAVLFSHRTAALESVNSTSVLMADMLIICSLVRQRLLNVNIYLSRTILFNSITILVVGVYLLAVGVLAKMINYWGDSKVLPLGTFFVFLAIVGLTTILLSDQLRHRAKRFISRHFYRSHYDYRQEWTTFTERTTSVIDVKGLCAIVSKMVSETFGVPAVTIWLWDEDAQQRVTLCGSTTFSHTQPQIAEIMGGGAVELCHYMQDRRQLVDFDNPPDMGAYNLKQCYPDFLRLAHIRYAVPLIAGQQLLGVMTLDNRLGKEVFTVEAFDLLKTIVDQTAATLLNFRLSHHLLKIKEMEAFQALSAFFVHDLKNLASKLSLMVQNLPKHYDNPEFRNDMLRVISKSVAKMNGMCSRLSLLTQRLKLNRAEVDLNELVLLTVDDLDGMLSVPLEHDLSELPHLWIDAEQLQKVLVNLLLNANEAVQGNGQIYIKTELGERWAVLSVRDNGCGMSREFMTQSLFQPFQTTKSEGLGIGLFHSKMIIEAHQGRIDVESKEGKGCIFRIFLPLSLSESYPT